MIICKIDDTGETFNSLAEVARMIGVTRQYVHQCKTNKSDENNHFYCGDYGVTVVYKHSQTRNAKYLRKWYKKRREQNGGKND